MTSPDEDIFREIALGLKTLHNGAFQLIREGRLAEARRMLENAGHISSMTGYREGLAMSLFSLANLALLEEKWNEAFHWSIQSMAYFDSETDRKKAGDFVQKAVLKLVKEGIELEARGEEGEALALFEMVLPYLKGKRREAVAGEICFLKGKGSHDETGSDFGGSTGHCQRSDAI